MLHLITRLTLLATCFFFNSAAQATASPEETAKLGNELTPYGAVAAGNADGSLPAWQGEKLFTEEQKNYTHEFLENMRNTDAKGLDSTLRAAIKPEWREIKFTITRENLAQHADKLTVGHKAMFEKYDNYKMNIYPSVRGAFFPEEIDRRHASR